MAIRSAIQFGAGRDDDRLSPGFKKASGQTFFGGLVVTSDNTDTSGKTIKLFSGTAALSASNSKPLGLVFESSVLFPVTNTTNADGQAGYGYDNLNYARGGLFSVFHRPGNLVDVFDDGRSTTSVTRTTNTPGGSVQPESCPFIASDSWAVGETVYATAQGLLTIDSNNATVVLGTVRSVSGSSASAVITVELGIDAV